MFEESDTRKNTKWIWAVVLGTLLSTGLLLALLISGCYAYSPAVLNRLWLPALAGLFVVPLEMERFAGEHTKRAFILVGGFTWATTAAIAFADHMPEHFYASGLGMYFFHPIGWIFWMSVVCAVAQAVVTKLRQSRKIAVWRWGSRAALVVLVILLTLSEQQARSRAFSTLKNECTDIYSQLGIDLPSDARWRADYGPASAYLCDFEPSSPQPSCTIVTKVDDWAISTYCTGNRPENISITGKCAKGIPKGAREALEILQKCPPVGSLPARLYPTEFSTDEDTPGQWFLFHNCESEKRPILTFKNYQIEMCPSYIEARSSGCFSLNLSIHRAAR